MGRYLFYLILVIGAITSVPALRTRAERPASAAYAHVAPLLRRVSDPVRTNITQRELKVISTKLKELRDSDSPMPSRRSFPDWVKESVTVGTDAWGSEYFLVFQDGSSVIGSPGPDKEAGTADDVLLALPW